MLFFIFFFPFFFILSVCYTFIALKNSNTNSPCVCVCVQLCSCSLFRNVMQTGLAPYPKCGGKKEFWSRYIYSGDPFLTPDAKNSKPLIMANVCGWSALLTKVVTTSRVTFRVLWGQRPTQGKKWETDQGKDWRDHGNLCLKKKKDYFCIRSGSIPGPILRRKPFPPSLSPHPQLNDRLANGVSSLRPQNPWKIKKRQNLRLRKARIFFHPAQNCTAFAPESLVSS